MRFCRNSKRTTVKSLPHELAVLVSALCIQIGMGIFGKSFGCDATSDLNETTWAWSMAFSITSVVLFCVVVFLQVLDQLRRCAKKGKHQGTGGHNNLGLNIT